MAYENRLDISKDDLKIWLGKCYGLDAVIGDTRPGYMSTVVWLKEQTVFYLLKVYGDENRDQLRFGITVNDRARYAGLPVAECVRTRQGEYLVDLGGHPVALWSHLPGDVFTSGNHKQLASAGEMLGRFHSATEQVDIDGEPARFLDVVFRDLQTVWDRVNDVEGGKLVVDWRKRLDEIWNSLNTSWPETIIHNDYRAQNLLFSGNQISGILDLDGTCLGPRIFDVVYALSFFQAVIAERPLSEVEMLAFLRGYHRNADLADAEFSHLGAWLSLALLKGMTLWLRIGYTEGSNVRARAWLAAYSDFFSEADRMGKRLFKALGRQG